MDFLHTRVENLEVIVFNFEIVMIPITSYQYLQ